MAWRCSARSPSAGRRSPASPLVEAYGLTETSPAACINPLDLAEYNGSIGLPIPSTDACVKDDAGNTLAPGEIGELCIEGPQVMKGYWQRPEETAQAIDADGWMHTGDIARMDEKGFFYIVDRKKDMILVSGFNVYPNEIEDVIAMMPGVAEVAAVGVPDEKSGEVVKVVIVKKDPNLTVEQVKEHARANLTGYKHPRIVEFRKELAQDQRRQDPASRTARRRPGVLAPLGRRAACRPADLKRP